MVAIAKVEWASLQTKGTAPCPRSGHSIVTLGRKAYLFGGCGSAQGGKGGGAFNDMFALDLDSGEWSQVECGGDMPLPRWRHSATQIEEKKFLVFGGLNKGQRYCDVYSFDTETNLWTKHECTGSPPTPKAHHSATLVGRQVYVFGGYGGGGKFFNDIHALDLDTWIWTKFNVKGNPPPPRSDHSACLCRSRFIVFGGQDGKTYYNDVHIFDIESQSWSKLGEEKPVEGQPAPPVPVKPADAANFPKPLCSHVAESIESVPEPKLFVFGGRRGAFMDYTNTVLVWDAGTMQWAEPPVAGSPPISREDTGMTYDSRSSKLVVFGGWANRWLGDVWTLNVAEIIGPPYAVLDLQPKMGPIPGGTTLIVKGMNFFDTPKVDVKFIYGGSEVLVQGKYVNETQIECKTPSFEKYGPQEVDVRVSLAGKTFNIQAAFFKYFDETRGEKCIAYGPAIMDNCFAGIPNPFIIQAKDKNAANRTSGGDTFKIELSLDGHVGHSRIVDNLDGTYNAFIIAPTTGVYLVHVSYDGKHIRGSPFKVNFNDPWVRLNVPGQAPLYRAHTVAAVAGKYLVHFGGDESYDLQLLDLESLKWSSPRINGSFPAFRRGHTYTPAGDKIVVWGGHAVGDVEEGHLFLGDVNFLGPEKDGSWTWSVPNDTQGTPPHARFGHLGVAMGRRLLYFGGMCSLSSVPPDSPINKFTMSGINGVLKNDLMLLSLEDGNKISWRAVPAEGVAPAGRIYAAGAIIGSKLYVIGGNVSGTIMNEMFVLNMENPDNLTWEGPIQISGFCPEARCGSICEVYDNELYLYGGSGADNKTYDDMCIFNPETLTWRRSYCMHNGRLAVMHNKKVYSIGNTDGSATFDKLECLDIGAATDSTHVVPLLSDYVTKTMREIEDLSSSLHTGLGLQVSEGNLTALLKVMGCVNDVKQRCDDIDLKFDTLVEASLFLKKTGKEMDAIDKKEEEKRQVWMAVKQKVPGVVEVIRPFKEKEGERVEKDLKDFADKVADFRKEFQQKSFFLFATGAAESYKALDQTLAQWKKHDRQRADLKKLADVFEFEKLISVPTQQLEECREELIMVKNLWDCASLVIGQVVEWKNTLWANINTEFMEEETKKFVKEIRALDKKIRHLDGYSGLDLMVKNFLTALPMVADLRHPSMRERHWESLMEETKVRFEITEEFKLDDLLALQLHLFVDQVGEIVDRAQKEEKMEKALEKLKETWSKIIFQFAAHKNPDVQLVKVAEEDFEVLEGDQVLVQNMMASKYVKVFESEASMWQKRLATVAEVTQILTEIQRTWSYLEDLFIGSEEVRRELPEDSVRFVKVDEEVKQVLKLALETPNIVETCTREGLFKHLEGVQKQLEVCEKALADYLEAKRNAFPRFYFISKPDLLDILSNGNRPQMVMVHLPKIFQAIKKLSLVEETKDGQQIQVATGMYAPEGEYVPFDKPCPLDGKVEVWLHRLIGAMKDSLRAILFKAIMAYNEKPREQWLFDFPSQLVLVASQIWWANEVVAAFGEYQGGKADAMTQYNQLQIAQLNKLINLVLGHLERGDRQKIMCLITLDTHARDVIANIVRDKVPSAEAFGWQSQLRIRWDSDQKDCFINICDAEFVYGYEYLGNGPRLVITPLTDRIYITATQSLHLILGCAPAGPAGTGKTETTKDLGSQLGKPVYVFNCSDQMDYRTMGDIFKGLASSGSWGCFDEFNRLSAEVLSVCSVQFKSILDAIKEKKEYFMFLGNNTKLDSTCGAFITMNPGYLGRTELPESLKALFRPVTVVVPDLELICENMLMAEGYIDAKVLARKFVTLYALCRDLLSKQDHYDWGLRAIKSVLVVAGGFKRAETTVSEHALLMRALRDFNLPKIFADDLVVFMGLIEDLFPSIVINRKRNLEFEQIIRDVCIESKLQPDEDFILKVVQLDELLAIRHCVFTLGPSGCGKSQCFKMLSKALRKVGKKSIWRDLSPKAITSNELYGYVQLATREWKDGLLSNIMREFANDPDTNPKWIILDGDLDANWIESMNSVMDDNKILTLASNERIQLLPHLRLIFEIRDLKFATPATVSRAGILFITEAASQWNSFVQSWIQEREDTEEQKEWIRELFAKYVGPTLIYVRKNFKHVLPILDFNMVQTLCFFLEGLLTPQNCPDNKEYKTTAEVFFVFAVVWAIGGALAQDATNDHRTKFNNWWKDEWKQVRFPTKTKTTIFDFYVDDKTRKFNPWTQLVPKLDFDSREKSMAQINVPTQETLCSMFWVNLLAERARPILLVGNAGCGKTALILEKLRNLPEEIVYTRINMNYFTDSMSLQTTMEQPLEKKAGKNYGPPGTKKMIYFIDDLNMPMVDPYNTQSPIELLRQHIDYGHWYDRTKLSLKNVHNCQYIACMNPTAGSFVVNPRLQRHFTVLPIAFPGQESLMTIYQTFLEGHLRSFDESVVKLGSKLLAAALDLHQKVVQTFRKTAINFHYEFNIRHLSNVFQGLLMSQPEQFKDPMKIGRLWIHESERTYGDLLVSNADLTNYRKLAKEVCKKYLREFDPDLMFQEPLIFCHFAGGLAEKIYNKVNTYDELKKILEEALNEYNETNAAMRLVLFEDAMKHVCRITRIISNPRGHALLVGVGGSGKQSLSRLAAHICGYSVFQITISQSYGTADLKEDIKQLYLKAGIKDESLLFLFTDSQITDERFLVYINDLLSSGEVAELFPPDDKENIINTVRSKVKAAGKADTRENCWEYFIDRVRSNLHMVLCFSPVGDGLRVRARRFPALVGCTVIDWFQPWPEEALLSVSKRFLGEVDLGGDDVRDAVVRFMPFSFQAVNESSARYLETDRRYNYTTPKSFLELIKLYKTMLAKKRQALQNSIERLQTGLEKLQNTSKEVAILEEELKVKMVEVEQKKAEADALTIKVGTEKAIVEEESAKAGVTAQQCMIVAAEVKQKQEDCERDLARAEPAVAAAEEALNTLNKKDLTELKSLKAPPSGVDDVTAAVLVLLSPPSGVAKDRSWQSAQKMMGSVDKFLSDLRNFKKEIDAERVPAANFKAVRPYYGNPNFKSEIIRNKSKAAAGLCDWVNNIVIYYDIICDVEPKRRALAAALVELEDANKRKEEAEAQVKRLEEQLSVLVLEFDEVCRAKDAVVAEAAKCERKLQLAQRLVNALASENVRWAQNVGELKAKLGVLVGDVLLASAFVSYIGCFNNRYRLILLNEKWLPFMTQNKIPMSPNLDPISILTNDAEIAVWNNEGLPSDRVSTENGAILTSCERWPLMIDPQLQGITWIKEKETKNNLQIVRLGQKRMLNTLERAIEEGFPVLIENIGEKIDAVLGPVLGRNTIKKGRNFFVRLGDKEVEYNPKFRLILHTKLSNPHYPPEIQAETTLINFTVTEDGLEDQLLARVVRKEKPELEDQKASLISQQNGFKIKLKELEDALLSKLSNAQGDILEDVELIENLEDTKRISLEIQEKVKIAVATEIQINEARENYRAVAGRGALLFFLMMNLVKIHTFYQYSLNSFVIVFERAIDHTQQAETLALRLDNLTETITYQVLNYIRRGLFEKHKLIVSTQLCLKILQKGGKLDIAELDYLIYGKKHPTPPPMSEKLQEFLSENSWAGLIALKDLPGFQKIADDIDGTARVHWKKWLNEEKPERCDLPGEYSHLSPFKKLLVVRSMRLDRMSGAMSDFVRATLGDRYMDSEQFHMGDTYTELGPAVPLMFILFPGADYAKDIESLGRELGFTEDNGRYVNISMGQGQESIAENSLDQLAQNGGWIFLQNIHLMQRWLPILERKLEVVAESSHPEFRCFLSAEPMGDPTIPVVPQSIVQSAVKVTNEPPQDLKANLRRAYGNFTPSYVERCSKTTEYKSCLFALCFFHALVLGRRKFGFQGWSRHYSFNTGDLTICADVLYNYLEGNITVPWEDVRYMFGEIMYGGHITDKWDRRTCSTYLKVLLRAELLQKMDLAPGFKAPDSGGYNEYKDYIEKALPLESPILFGLHPNAEINFLTAEGDYLFKTILELQGSSSGGGGSSREEAVSALLESLLSRLPEDFNMLEIGSKVEDKSPFVCVLLQEIERMNILMGEIRRSLNELKLGLQGALNMSEVMENLANALFLDRVPALWEKYAYPSLKRLAAWFNNLLLRVEQLTKWVGNPSMNLPPSVWISGLFNPMSFLTAIMQVTARRNNLPLDRMTIQTDLVKLHPDKVETQPAEGAYIHGLFFEGAGWDPEEGCLRDSIMKELHPMVPVVHVTAVKVDDRVSKGIYECPVYLTSQRGFTYVFTATLRTNDPEHKWVLAGVAMLMNDD